MEIMLLIIVLLYFMWSIAVLVFDADIWLRSKLRIEKTNVAPKESPPIPADDFIVRHTYTVSPKKVPSEPVQIKQEDDGETIRENEVTFEDDQSSMKSARIPDNKLDEVFTDTRIEDVDVKYDESEEEPVVEQASVNMLMNFLLALIMISHVNLIQLLVIYRRNLSFNTVSFFHCNSYVLIVIQNL